MTDKIHPVVELLAARMESHPEEFGENGSHRWAQWLDQLIPFVTEEERVMLRRPMMQDIHEEVLDELMNGPERRAEEKRKRDEEMQRHIAHAAAQQRAAQQSALSQYQNAMGQYRQAQATGIVGKSPSGIWVDEYAQLGSMTTQSTKLQIGSETIDEGMIKKIKKKLGI